MLEEDLDCVLDLENLAEPRGAQVNCGRLFFLLLLVVVGAVQLRIPSADAFETYGL